MFLQIHFLTSYPPSLLNRDDSGLAKRIVFGNTERLRISSQSQKRHWRTWMEPHFPAITSWRTRQYFSKILLKRIIEHPLSDKDTPISENDARAYTIAIAQQLLTAGKKAQQAQRPSSKGSGKKGGGKNSPQLSTEQQSFLNDPADTDSATTSSDSDPSETPVINLDTLETSQPILFGEPETRYFASLALQMHQLRYPLDNDGHPSSNLALSVQQAAEQILPQKHKDNLQALLAQTSIHDPMAGLAGALFGRFVTSDIDARVDAPVHVAHALTTHALQTDLDFFTVVDDLLGAAETGAAHMGDAELGSGLFYGYVVVDVPLLVSNLMGSPAKDWATEPADLPKAIVEQLIRAIATVSPGAKLGATAPHAYAQCVLLEAGTEQPRSLANAFLQPITGRTTDDLGQQSITALGKHLDAYDRMYGTQAARAVASLYPWVGGDLTPVPLNTAIQHILAA
ncbi:MAG: type I-E CRISPR-associated protein Cas7/Cse4/CasC, partial [Sulfobacillus sp.]